MVKLGNWLFHYRNFLFPVFYLALFIPSPWLFPKYSHALILGAIIILMGILVRCITIGFVYIIRGGKNRRIYAESLVTDGVYSMCRNPMYLGNILLLLGFGIFANSLIFMLVFFPLFVIFYYAIIKAEEAFLSDKFGEDFDLYRNRVNALFPSLLKVNNVFQNHRFDFKRVFKKEYNSLFIYLTGILLLLLYHRQITWSYFILFFSFLLLAYLMMKILKWSRKI